MLEGHNTIILTSPGCFVPGYGGRSRYTILDSVDICETIKLRHFAHGCGIKHLFINVFRYLVRRRPPIRQHCSIHAMGPAWVWPLAGHHAEICWFVEGAHLGGGNKMRRWDGELELDKTNGEGQVYCLSKYDPDNVAKDLALVNFVDNVLQL